MDTCSDSVHVVDHRLRHCLCFSCGHPHRSQPGIRVRCAACGARYRPECLERELKILRYFCLEISVYRFARELRMSFPPIWRRFMAYRRWMATVAEAEAQPLCGNFGMVKYQVVMKRSLRTANATQDIQFETGRSFRSHFSSGTAPMGRQAARWR